ncbi:MAG: class I SAM-dependent methyltransferase [Balneolaceae bacterium]
MNIEVRSPLHDSESITLPEEVTKLSRPFNGTICSKKGDEYVIKNNIIDLLTKEKSYTLAQSTNHWKLTATVYEDIWRVRSLSLLTGEPFPIEKEKVLLEKWIAPKPGGKYLDIGCSTAMYARSLKKSEPECESVAIDFSMAMLEEARIKAEADETDILLIRADARDLPFFGNTFDGIVMGGTLNELSDEMKVLYECHRVLKEEGTLFMMHLLLSDSWYGRVLQNSAEWSGIKFWTLKKSNELFKKAGFHIEDQFAKGIVCFTKLKSV